MELNSKKFQEGARPWIPLEACAFGARLGSWSVFILDLRLVVSHGIVTVRLLLSIHLQHLPVEIFLLFLRLETINNSNGKMPHMQA